MEVYAGYGNRKIYSPEDIKKFAEVSRQLMAYEHSGITWKSMSGAPIPAQNGDVSKIAIGSKKLKDWQYLRMECTDKYNESAKLQNEINDILSGITPERLPLTEGEKPATKEIKEKEFNELKSSSLANFYGGVENGKKLADDIKEKYLPRSAAAPKTSELSKIEKKVLPKGTIPRLVLDSGIDLRTPEEADYWYDAVQNIRIKGMDRYLRERELSKYYSRVTWNNFFGPSIENFQKLITADKLIADYLTGKKKEYAAEKKKIIKKEETVPVWKVMTDFLHPQKKAEKSESEKQWEREGNIWGAIKASQPTNADNDACNIFQNMINRPNDKELRDLMNLYLSMQKI